MTLSESDDSWVGVMYPYRVRNICYWHEQSALQSVTVKRSTGNNDSGPLFSSLFCQAQLQLSAQLKAELVLFPLAPAAQPHP